MGTHERVAITALREDPTFAGVRAQVVKAGLIETAALDQWWQKTKEASAAEQRAAGLAPLACPEDADLMREFVQAQVQGEREEPAAPPPPGAAPGAAPDDI